MINHRLAIAHEEEQAAKIERLRQTTALLQDRIALLERDNGELTGMLKERGVAICSRSATALELPPPLTAPTERIAEIRALMTPAAQRLLADICGAAPVLILLKTGSTTDTGNWLHKGRVWAAATAEDLVLLAGGSKPFFQKAPFTHLDESLYNHVTGELVLAPNRGWRLARVAMPPLDGYQLLAQIYNHQTQGEKP
ncbi:MAG: hypothetical protein KKE37_01290 [Verrucomicrobia bacterium]|nr:hypothetical protein [Verrucomicrobiota bacterium]MBU4427968.1 hypothetical protein [Verrucomicrobiota bacterium]MCG2681556.1 hypothetical protein [Kiritimatiellia bacterium]